MLIGIKLSYYYYLEPKTTLHQDYQPSKVYVWQKCVFMWQSLVNLQWSLTGYLMRHGEHQVLTHITPMPPTMCLVPCHTTYLVHNVHTL